MKLFKTKNTKRIEQLESQVQTLQETVLEFIDSVAGLRTYVENVEENVDDENTNLRDKLEEVFGRLEAAEANMDDYKRYREEKEMLKNSGEPWVDFETRVVDNEGRVEVKMDWNAEFIDYLKKEGFKASSDEELVSIYFSSLVREAGDELSEDQAEKYMNNE